MGDRHGGTKQVVRLRKKQNSNLHQVEGGGLLDDLNLRGRTEKKNHRTHNNVKTLSQLLKR